VPATDGMGRQDEVVRYGWLSVWCRRVAVTGACIVVPAVAAPWPSAHADPAVPPSDTAQADDGSAPAGAPVSTVTPAGCTLTVGSDDESQVPVPPLTTAITSREYEVGGTFVGSVVCPGD
jgi:MspA